MHEKQEARREVRRMIGNKVKSNWAFDLKSYKANTRHPQHHQHHVHYQHNQKPETFTKIGKESEEVLEWRERYYGSSLSSSSSSLACMIEEFSSGSGSDSGSTDDSKNDLMILSSSPSLSFSDGVMDKEEKSPVAVVEKKVSKKRKQIAREEEEACWNEGFALWKARRDAWTGAVTKCSGSEYGGVWSWQGGDRCTADRPRQTAKTTSTAHDRDADDEEREEEVDGRDCSSGNSTSPEPSSAQSSITPPENITTTLPVSKPLVSPTNAIRATITPAIYAEIFNTVVISGRSPSIPINLTDMTRALVKGWRDNGEWPPKPGACAAAAPVAKKNDMAVVRSIASGGKHAHLKKGVESMRRVLRLGHEHGHHAIA